MQHKSKEKQQGETQQASADTTFRYFLCNYLPPTPQHNNETAPTKADKGC